MSRIQIEKDIIPETTYLCPNPIEHTATALQHLKTIRYFLKDPIISTCHPKPLN